MGKVETALLKRHATARERIKCLTERERQVLSLLVDGKVSKQIGPELGISPKTVEIHRSNLLRKLSVTTSLAAVCIGAYAGLGECGFWG